MWLIDIMKFYIAASFERKDEVRKLYEMIKERGHETSSDWTTHKSVRPFNENQELSKEYSAEDAEGAKNCDVFILLSDEKKCRGAHVELGAAIASNVEIGKPVIYVVGEHRENSMFYFHPSVKRRETIEEVLEEVEKL